MLFLQYIKVQFQFAINIIANNFAQLNFFHIFPVTSVHLSYCNRILIFSIINNCKRTLSQPQFVITYDNWAAEYHYTIYWKNPYTNH